VVLTSGKIAFSGFPANMGEAGMRMTLEGFGPLVSFEFEPNDDGMTAGGQAEYETTDAAKACIDKYDGVDVRRLRMAARASDSARRSKRCGTRLTRAWIEPRCADGLGHQALV
jgi:hypothetical protein